tara:strand:+ start:1025 stop:1315 length:291 start_codon:yes stop_codon:yes gene_type:complete
MKYLLLSLLAAFALPTKTYGLDVNYLRSLSKQETFTYGSAVGASGIMCTSVSTGKIKKQDATRISLNLLNKISWPEYHRGWNDGLIGREKCTFLKY